MPTTQVTLRKGTAAENNAFTGASGEVTVDTTNNSLRVHDGIVAGGFITPTLGSNGNFTIGGTLTANGNVNTTNISATGNLTVANLVFTNANISGNIDVTGRMSAGGNVTGANLITTGLLTVVGNITSNARISAVGNVLSGGILSAAGNITGANVSTTGIISAGGNITAGNVSTTGNVTANYVLGNGSQLVGVTSLSSGTSNVRIVTLDGNVAIGIGGNSNVAVFGTGTITLKANVVPDTANVFSLGNASHRWTNLWVSGNTITLGNIVLNDENASELGIYTSNGTTPANVKAQIINTAAYGYNTSNITATGNISSAYNTLSAGPITINSGITVTVNTGAFWTIV